MNIKETLELLNALQIAGVAVAKIAKDGKVNAEDLPVLLSLSMDFSKLVDGFSGAGEIPEELKDLDEAEVMAIISKLFVIGKAVKKELE